MKIERGNYIYEIPEELGAIWDGLSDMMIYEQSDKGYDREYGEKFDETFDKYKKINPVVIITEILKEVLNERIYQDKKWGEQNRPPEDWLMILGEEVGECNQAALEVKFGYNTGKTYNHLREELIQVAAVAVSFVESLDRNELKNS